MLTGEQWSRRVMDAADEGIWVVDPQGRTVDANAAAARLLGRALEEMPGLSVAETLDDLGRAQWQAHLDAVRRSGASVGDHHEVECLLHRPDGTELWATVRQGFLLDETGGLEALVLTFTDHSERRRLLAELRLIEQRQREAEYIARLGSWTWSPDGGFQFSEGVRRLYGDRVEQVFASYDSFLAALHPEDVDRVQAAVTAAGEAGEPFEFEARVHGPHGWMWIRGRGLSEYDADGTLVSVTGVHQDITRARDTDDALQDLVTQNSLMQALATAANEATSLHDVLGQAKHLVLLHDDWDRARAYTPDGLGGLSPYHVDDADRLEDEQQTEPGLLARERRAAADALNSREAVWDDETRLTVAFPILLDDEVVAVVAITSRPPLYRHEMIASMTTQVADQLARVAERERQALAVAEARDRAVEASRHKSEFLATMSHEIRTPLNGIVGLTELLGRTQLDDKQRHLVSGVDLSGRQLMAVINDILDFSKIEAGHLSLEEVDFEVRTVLDQVSGVVGEAARAKGLDLGVSCAPDVPEVVNGDPTRLLQVLINLGSNAVKFTSSGGVDIRASVVATADQGRGLVLGVEVRDTGVGVDPERAASIFQPFSQADASTTRRYGGTGLGLAICREIVTATGGDIGVRPAQGGGSVFWFEMPLASSRGTRMDDPAAGVRTQLEGLQVLVVDDVATNREILTEQLSWWGVDPIAVPDAASALQVVRQRRVDVVVLDMAMPEIDGLMLADLLRREPATGDARLVMLTSGLPLPSATLAEHGIRECLSKPVPSGALRDLLLRVRPGVTRGEVGVAETMVTRPGRVLVVEDNEINRVVATGFLESWGLRPDTAVDGVEALEMLERSSYDLVLMDVQMPRLDGYATTRALRERERAGDARRTPVVAMTASAVRGERERALEAGMDDFLTKPVVGVRLSAVVERWLPTVETTEDPAAPDDPGAADAGAAGAGAADAGAADAGTADAGAADAGAAGPAPGAEANAAAPPADASLVVLDVERLDELAELSPDGRYLRTAVGRFGDRATALVDDVRDAPDEESRGRAAHALAGAASNLGLVRLTDLARGIETRARAGEVGPTPPDLEEASLREALEEGQAALTMYVADRGWADQEPSP
ncbi:response regulator [Nocardioides acrostichi]|uniref:Circadian input-output histidine kinase CikA n=1 Tax=Nocardioides acrostichi TaxID=2784339 RepID=A0A930V417_9ACTN|nr:response regulator [Nocardioides acrostichi]MBF4163427.1 response regulator [Nocardioides acrostichi]